MKKVIFSLLCIGAVLISCQDEENEVFNETANQEVVVDMSDFYAYTDIQDYDRQVGGKECHSMQVLNRNLDNNPSLYNNMFNIEKNIRAVLASKKPGNGNGNGNGNGGGGNDGGGDTGGGDTLGTITIPVVVHVIYSNSNENISDAQINSQINVLNEDFNLTNSDASQVPALFEGLVADSDINFVLDQTIRVSSNTSSWGTNDAMKFSSNGGSNVVSPDTHLNIWVCNIGGGILGYAQFPGGSASTDGVVVSPQYFGNTGTAQAPFDGGRTTTHEVGHWLNLRHIWGDGRCNRDDFVGDTPRSDRPNYGCPGFPTTHCRSTDMTMNYMDYVNDDCMYMFSNGQKDRMRALFETGGPRSGFIN